LYIYFVGSKDEETLGVDECEFQG